jgi:hypothetical protein
MFHRFAPTLLMSKVQSMSVWEEVNEEGLCGEISAHLDCSVGNHAGGNLCDGIVLQKVLAPLILLLRIKFPTNAFIFDSTLIAENAKGDLITRCMSLLDDHKSIVFCVNIPVQERGLGRARS